MKRLSITTVLGVVSVLGAAWAPAASAQSSLGWGSEPQLIEEYSAYIGRDDVRNSDGVRLTKAWQVIRQDRANYHRYGIRDRGDQTDAFFASAENREIMERMVRDGKMSPSAAKAVVQGGVRITVGIYGRGTVGRYVEVTVN